MTVGSDDFQWDDGVGSDGLVYDGLRKERQLLHIIAQSYLAAIMGCDKFVERG